MTAQEMVKEMAKECVRKNIEDIELKIKMHIYPKTIFFDTGATVVFWMDGTKTVVRRSDKDREDPEAAFCAALAKQVYGTNSAIKRLIRDRGKLSKRKREAESNTAESAFEGMWNAFEKFCKATEIKDE